MTVTAIIATFVILLMHLDVTRAGCKVGLDLETLGNVVQSVRRDSSLPPLTPG